jgi:hypothetical protein
MLIRVNTIDSSIIELLEVKIEQRRLEQIKIDMHYKTTKKWCRETESNHRHEALQASALPLSYLGIY